MNYTLLLLPGLGAHADLNRAKRLSSLAEPLMALCQKRGWTFETIDNWDSLPTVEKAVEQVWRQLRLTNNDTQVLVVASSFGGWALLRALQRHTYPNLGGVVLVNPFFTLEGFTGKLPPLVLAGLKAFATRFGFTNLNFGLHHYWVPATMIRSFLNPENSVFGSWKAEPRQHSIVFLDKADGRSAYKADSDNGRLLQLLGIAPTPVMDAVPEIGKMMEACVSESIKDYFDKKHSMGMY